MKHSENDVNELSVLFQELKLLKERISTLEASVFGSQQNSVPNGPVGHEQILHAPETMDVHDAHITVQSQQGAIAIAIRSPSTPSRASVCTLSSHQPAMFGSPSPSPTPILNAPPLTPIPPVPSQSTSSWGPMMTPGEVKELLVPHPQIGEYYVVTKGRRPGVYLTWADAHELVDGLRSPCYWKKTDKHSALGQYTLAYKKGNCEYRFQ